MSSKLHLICLIVIVAKWRYSGCAATDNDHLTRSMGAIRRKEPSLSADSRRDKFVDTLTQPQLSPPLPLRPLTTDSVRWNPNDDDDTDKWARAAGNPDGGSGTNVHNNLIITDHRPQQPHSRTSLVIVFDGTLSMFDDLQQLKSGAKLIINEIASNPSSPIYNYIFVPFRDPVIGPKIETTDQNRFLDAIDQMEIYGGGDCPESALRGIEMALESALEKAFVFVFTDATATDFHMEEAVLQLVQDKQATVTFLLTGYCKAKDSAGFTVYETIAEASNGQVFELQKADIGQVLASVKDMLDERYVPLKVIKAEAGVRQSVELNVDANLKEFSVSVSGTNPEIDLQSPRYGVHSPASGVHHEDDSIRLANLKIVKVHQPETGTWNIRAGSESKHSIRVAGISELVLEFGFSPTADVRDIKLTTFVPILGTLNRLYVSAKNTENLKRLTVVEFRFANDSNVGRFELPLQFDDASGLYHTDDFLPPRSPFQLFIRGIDVDHRPIERILSTLIKSSLGRPPVPILTVQHMNEVIFIKCTTSSPGQVQLVLRKDGRIMETKYAENYPEIVMHKQSELSDSGNYSCNVRDEFGSRTQSQAVDTTPFTLTVTPLRSPAIEGMLQYVLKCDVSKPTASDTMSISFATSLPNEADVIQRQTHADRLVLRRLSRNMTGEYVRCIATFAPDKNRTPITSDKWFLDIQYPVEREMGSGSSGDNGNREVWLKVGESIRVPCGFHGNPRPKITWIMPGRNQFAISDHDELIVTNMTAQWHNHRVTCRASNAVSSEEVENVITLIRKPSKRPMLKITVDGDGDGHGDADGSGMREQPVFEGGNLTLSCSCKACQPIRDAFWMVNGLRVDYIVTGDVDYDVLVETEPVSDGIALHMRVHRLEAGPFTAKCFMENLIGNDTAVFDVQIQRNEPPTIIGEKSASVIVERMGSVSLTCFFLGHPIPQRGWYRNDVSLNTSVHSLELTNFTAAMAGEYKCVGTNSVGAAAKMYDVQLAPHRMGFLLDLPNRNVTVALNDAEVLFCPIENATAYRWFKDDSLLDFEDMEAYNLFVTGPETLGVYKCVGEAEDGGTLDFSFEVQFAAKPQEMDIVMADEKLDLIVLHRGENLNFTCPGDTISAFRWLKDNETVADAATLFIVQVDVTDTGIYHCEVYSKGGLQRHSINVQIMSKPEYTGDSNQLVILSGSSVQLNCSVVSYPAPRFEWFRDNDVQVDSQTDTLTVHTSGSYKCLASNDFGIQVIHFHVISHARPKILSFSANQTVTVNQSVVVSCEAQALPLPIMAVLRNGKREMATSRIYFNEPMMAQLNEEKELLLDEHGNGFSRKQMTFNVAAPGSPAVSKYGRLLKEGNKLNLSLIIPHASPSDDGIYTCVALNTLGQANDSATVHVYEKPKLIEAEFESMHQVIEGLPLILKCPVEGTPAPRIYWLKNEETVEAGDRILLQQSGTQLIVKETLNSDRGTYECVGKNVVGNMRANFSVDILLPPYIVKSPANHSVDISVQSDTPHNEEEDSVVRVTVQEGQELHLHCPIEGNPEPNIFWNAIKFSPNAHKTMLEQTGSVLTLPEVTSSATYQCFANNSLGDYEIMFIVEMEHAPKFNRPESETISMQLLSTTLLSCRLEANPRAQVTWYHNSKKLRFQRNMRLSFDSQILKLINVRQELSGIYTCAAENKLGRITKSFTLDVHVPVIWSPWHAWSECSHSCGLGTRHRNRTCMYPNGDTVKVSRDKKCLGPHLEKQKCLIIECPIDGTWSKWSKWSTCSLTCLAKDHTIQSIKSRFRECNNPAPAFGGESCIGPHRQQEICDVPYCPIDGGWSAFSEWSACSSSCGAGMSIRSRLCNDPEPKFSGKECEGGGYEVRPCNVGPCPTPGTWSEWSEWSSCSQTCGQGVKRRSRQCEGGTVCTGDNMEARECEEVACPVVRLDRIREILAPITNLFPREVDNGNNDQFELAEGKGLTLVNNNYKGQKVTVTLEQLFPLARDITDFHFIANGQSVPAEENCPTGFIKNSGSGACEDLDECSTESHSCTAAQVCVNTIGSHTCDCLSGFEHFEDAQRCVDVDECSREIDECSHFCENTAGSYRCFCPQSLLLLEDGRTCVEEVAELQDVPQNQSALTMASCPDGYSLEDDGRCGDFDECAAMEDDCGPEQVCLNTKGSYECVPVACPDSFTNGPDETFAGNCVQLCNATAPCVEGAIVAHTISHTILSLRTFKVDVPFLKLISYDVNRRPIDSTRFQFQDQSDGGVFRLEEPKPGIVYLFAKKRVKSGQVYKIQVVGHSMDKRNQKLLYIHKYIIYFYLF